MNPITTMKHFFHRLCLLPLVLTATFVAATQENTRQRNVIFVLDCTSSMDGYNGAPNVWQTSKDFLHDALEKESKGAPNSKVVILPFQDKVLHPINVDLTNISWANIERVLNNYVVTPTSTNICDSWLAAESRIDASCFNYIYLLTDGVDNIGGTANQAKRNEMLQAILSQFCNKEYANTIGFYVRLTEQAAIPQSIQQIINDCPHITIIEAMDGIKPFGNFTDNVKNFNTRDLPVDLTFSFSNPDVFNALLQYEENPFISITLKDGKINHGKATVHLESKFGNNIQTLNQAIDDSILNINLQILSEEVYIVNPELTIEANVAPLRCLDFADSLVDKVDRGKPFLWIKGNPADTLRWNLNAQYNDGAKVDGSSAMFKINGAGHIIYNGAELSADSLITLLPEQDAVIEVIVPQEQPDSFYNITLAQVNAHNLDRINGQRPDGVTATFYGTTTTSISLIEIIFWSFVGMILLFLIVWFLFIRNSVYHKFKGGIIRVQQPYYASIQTKGCRKVVMTAKERKQSLFDRIWRGKVIYHVNPEYSSDVEITPTSHRNMRFHSVNGAFVCEPSNLLRCGETYWITCTNSHSTKIKISIN